MNYYDRVTWEDYPERPSDEEMKDDMIASEYFHQCDIFERDYVRMGDFYEDCRYHPMVCIENDDGDLSGVSLVSGGIGSCSIGHCGVVRLTYQQAYDLMEKWREVEDLPYGEKMEAIRKFCEERA